MPPILRIRVGHRRGAERHRPARRRRRGRRRRRVPPGGRDRRWEGGITPYPPHRPRGGGRLPGPAPARLPCRRPGVSGRLVALGLDCVGAVANLSSADLQRQFGLAGKDLWHRARGEDGVGEWRRCRSGVPGDPPVSPGPWAPAARRAAPPRRRDRRPRGPPLRGSPLRPGTGGAVAPSGPPGCRDHPGLRIRPGAIGGVADRSAAAAGKRGGAVAGGSGAARRAAGSRPGDRGPPGDRRAGARWAARSTSGGTATPLGRRSVGPRHGSAPALAARRCGARRWPSTPATSPSAASAGPIRWRRRRGGGRAEGGDAARRREGRDVHGREGARRGARWRRCRRCGDDAGRWWRRSAPAGRGSR